MENSKKINLRGIIQLDQIENFFSHIIERLNSQDHLIQNLQSLCDNLLSKSFGLENFDMISKQFNDVNNRLDFIHSLCYTKVGSKV